MESVHIVKKPPKDMESRFPYSKAEPGCDLEILDHSSRDKMLNRMAWLLPGYTLFLKQRLLSLAVLELIL